MWEVNSSRKPKEYCESCRARKTNKIQDCLIWQGHYDSDQVTPIHDNGNPVMIGKRTCGHADCVNINHLERE